MRKSARVWASALFACAIAFSGLNVSAQSAVTPEQEYKKRIHVTDDVSPLGENPFGERIGLYDGSLSFNETDVSANGIGPAITLSRSFSIPEINPSVAFHPFHANAFVDWSLDLPHIETLSAPEQNTVAGVLTWQWFLLDDYQGTTRCSSFDTAPSMFVSSPGTVATYDADSWWHGYQLVMPGEGAQTLLARSGFTTTPQMTDANGAAINFPIITKEKWAVGCLAQTANGVPGEGYLAVSPDGTKYWLDWVTYRSADAVVVPGSAALKRRTLMFMVSKVVDRFGNTVNYGYDGNGNLTSIQASDGRQVTINWAQWQVPTADPGPVKSPSSSYTSFRITSIVLQPNSAAPRTWSYAYSSDPTIPRLTSVQLPDGSSWSFNLGGLPATNSDSLLEFGDKGTCLFTAFPDYAQSGSGTITHPSGLVGTFGAQTMIRSRSNVNEPCNNPILVGRLPTVYATTSITSKSVSGTGVTPATWRYTYSPSNPSWAYQCGGGCVTTTYTDMLDPAGNTTRYTFSNQFDATETLLQRTDAYAGAVGGTPLRSEILTYASPTGGPWPASLGLSRQLPVNAAQLQEWIPVVRKDIVEEGDTYRWNVDLFDTYAMPLVVTRYNSFQAASTLQEQTGYLNDLPHWTLGLPTTVVNTATGVVESENVYNAANVTLQARKAFGQTLMTYAFDGQGQLASFADNKGNTTTLGNYKRGIPQAIGFPDGTSESVSVDDLGQVASLTDQAQHTTSYTYDAMGRLASITYPAGHALTCTGDQGTWNAQHIVYEYVGDERGIGGAHWRRTVTQGSKVSVTYFDAMLRPILASSYRAGDLGLETSARTDFDWRSAKTFVSYPLGANPDFVNGNGTGWTGVTTYYDALGRAYQTVQASENGNLTTSTSYLANATKQVTDARGIATITAYQAFDTPSYDKPILVTAPEGITQQIARDVYGSPTSIVQSGGGNAVSKSMVYDGYHRLCRTTEPESGSEVFAYDDANNIVWQVAGAAQDLTGCGQDQVAAAAGTTRTYDKMNRVLSIQYPVGSNTDAVTYTYDPLGNPAAATSGITSWTYGRNELGLLTQEQLQVEGYVWSIGYGYDANQAPASTTYPDNQCAAYAPDALGRPTQVGAFASAASYAPDGSLASFNLGNGTPYVAQENARNLLGQFRYGTLSAPSLSEALSYDPNANVTGITDQVAGGQRSRSMIYDNINRLTQATAGNLWGTESYTYDALNNIRSITNSGGTNTYNYNALNQLDSITNAGTTLHQFIYDLRGNTTSKDGAVLTFDLANRLTAIAGTDSYAYDAAGRRVKKAPTGSGATPTYYAYNGAGQLLWQFDPSTSNGKDYFYLGSKLVASTDTITSKVIGNVEGVSNATSATATLTGWTCSDGFPDSLSVRVYLGGPAGTGTLLGTFPANVASEPAVATACHSSGAAYRFTVALTDATRITYGNQPIYVVGVGLARIGSDDQLLPGSGNAIVPASITAPLPSASVTATASGNLATISVSWTASARATVYSVKQTYNGVGGSPVNIAGTTMSVNNPADGTYSYSVSACSANGCSAATTSANVVIAHIPPAPSSISVPSTSTGIVPVSWPATAYATVYELEQSLNGGPWNTVYHGGATSQSVNVGVTASAVYRLQACNANGCSAFIGSSAVAITVPPASAPSIAGGGVSNSGAWTISWTGVAGATAYNLAESVNGGGWTGVQYANASSWSTSGRVNGTYAYMVQACNAGGCGPWSGTTTVSVALIPATPTGFTLTQTGSARPNIHLTWNASAYATYYNIEYTNPPYLPVVTNWGNVTSVSQVTLASGLVEYRVQACNATGCSAWSLYQTDWLAGLGG